MHTRSGGNFSINGGYPVCGTGSISVGGTITGTPCSSLSLPVTWLEIAVKEYNESIRVDWKTAAELNNDYFTIQKSTDGINFVPAGRIDGAGNSTFIKEYSFTDYNPLRGLSYYRIAQTDFDGTTDVSQTYTVVYTGEDAKIGVVQPLSGGGLIQVVFNDMKDSKAEISLYHMGGVLINKEWVMLSSEHEVVEFSTPVQLSRNLCLITVKTENVFYSRRIVIGN